MKRKWVFIVTCIICFTFLFGCNSSSQKDGSNPSSPSSSEIPEDTPQTPEASSDDVSSSESSLSDPSDSMGADVTSSSSGEVSPVDMEDGNNYYAIIDGVTYDLRGSAKISDLLAKGYYSKDFDFSQMVDAGSIYVGEGLFDVDITFYKDGVDKPYFYAYIVNLSDSPVPVSEATIRAFMFSNPNIDIQIAGNINLGTPIDELKAVWGEPSMEGPPSMGKYMVNYSYSGLDTFIGIFGFEVREETNEISGIVITYDVIY